MKDPRRANFIQFFGYLFPCASDTMVVKCWRESRTHLPDEHLDALIASFREAVIGKAHAAKSLEARQ